MAKIVAVHSYRGGTGKSNITANLAALLAADGARVGAIDTDIQSPGIHAIFNLDRGAMSLSLNDFLWGRCPIERVAYSLGSPLSAGDSSRSAGELFLVPASMNAGEIARVLREGYDVAVLNEGLSRLVETLGLDYLLIDTHPGLNEETLLSMAIADMLFLVLRPDRQDFLGSAVTLEVARQLDVPDVSIVINKVPRSNDVAALKEDVETTFRAPVRAILPLSEEALALGSRDLVCKAYPASDMSGVLRDLARSISRRARGRE